MELGNRMVTSGGNRAGESVREEAIGTHRDNLSPKLILNDQYKSDRGIVDYKTIVKKRKQCHNTPIFVPGILSSKCWTD